MKDEAKPLALTAPHRVPVPLLPKVKAELNRMKQLGVIVSVKESSDRCSGMVVVPKPQDKVRICVDLTQLNKSVRREHHQLPDTGTVGWSKNFHKIRCQLGILADTAITRVIFSHNIHNSI